MSFLPSSVRLLSPSPIIIFTRHVSGSHRYVKGGKPKPALAPLLRSPHHPKLPLRSSGASQPHPRDLSPSYTPTTSSVPLDNGLVLHHSPPASAPSHMTGSVPPLLKWLGGESVRLTGEEEAPALRGWEPARGDVVAGWSEELKERMREMRARGMSRADIARSLEIPREHETMIQRVAPLTGEQLREKETALDERKATWGHNKRLSRASRAKRREFW